MPELPEVETVVRTLRPRVVGWRILGVECARPEVLRPRRLPDWSTRLIGRQVRTVNRRGKKIVILLDDESRFYVHLGMTGQLTVESPQTPCRPHTHWMLVLGSADRQAMAYLRFRDPRRFGGVWWLGRDGRADENLGPEPLGLKTTELARLLSRTRRAIKCALLDQRLIAGLGNIYVDESLFRAGIHPLWPANVLTRAQVAALNRAIQSTLRQAIRHRGSTLRDYIDVNGQSGHYQDRHLVYKRDGKSCHGCGTAIQRIVLGGRSTHFCPACQPSPPTPRATGERHPLIAPRRSGRPPGDAP